MLETDSALAPIEVTDLDSGMLLELATDTRELEWRAARRKLRVAHQLCVTNPAGDGVEPACWEELLELDLVGADVLGGEGSPWVAKFLPEEWATATGVSTQSAKRFLADTLDLHHRLIRTWSRVDRLELEAWRARRLAEDTRHLSLAAARWIDAHLDARGSYSLRAIEAAIKTGIAKFHPDLLEASPGSLGRADWDVTLDHHTGSHGTSRLDAVGDSVDLAKFLDLVNDEAATAGRLGDTDSLGQRRAKALGTIADQQATLDLAGLLPTATGAAGRDAVGPEAVLSAGGDLVHPDTGALVRRRSSYGKARVFIHIDAADLAAFDCGDQARVGDAGRLGPQTIGKLAEWLRRFGPDAKITPVLDLNRSWSVDQHDPPASMREQVIIRDRHCVFPHCQVDARSCDVDHIEAYAEDGPPGQTAPEKLACLCRRHHLAKTHGRWSYLRNKDGTYTWTSQHGRTWLVTHFGTVEITTT